MKSTENNTVQEEEGFDLYEFCRRHLRVSSWASGRNLTYNSKELNGLLDHVLPIFKEQPALVTLSPPCTIVGDIHGQYRDLIRILNSETIRRLAKNEKKSKRDKDEKGGADKLGINNRYMFLGDYVDRGANSIECICLVFSLKCIYPKQYMLLRGNHETKSTNYTYGFREELVNKLGEKEGLEIWRKFNNVFNYMPCAGLVGARILCMHGGISPYLNSLDDIRNIKRPYEGEDKENVAFDLLWSDPAEPLEVGRFLTDDTKPAFFTNEMRGCSVSFNEAEVKHCLKKLNIDLIVRAHQVKPIGYSFFADKKLITIFSAPKYGNSDNKGSVLKVSKAGIVSISTFATRETPKGDTTIGD